MSARVMQRAIGGRDNAVHATGTVGSFGVRIGSLCTYARGRHLLVRVGYLPGMQPGLQTSTFFYRYSVQVLTGGDTFPGTREVWPVYKVVHGLRPKKPKNAAAIGFSDPLWGFVQRCWDGSMELRPVVAEVVTCLGNEAANWDRVMSHALVENDISNPEEPTSVSTEYREFEILIYPWYRSLSNGAGGFFPSSSDATPEGPTESTPPCAEADDTIPDFREEMSGAIAYRGSEIRFSEAHH